MNYGILFVVAVLVLIFVLRPRSRDKRNNGHGYPSWRSLSHVDVVEPQMGFGIERGIDPFAPRPAKTIAPASESMEEVLKRIEGASIDTSKPLRTVTKDDPWNSVEPDQIQRL